ncbi:MAG: hypothetical protein II232_02055, partial [Spirochaetaceae bacterium]|nr:hypothetical protein [Spirochaetaceae bacterium]
IQEKGSANRYTKAGKERYRFADEMRTMAEIMLDKFERYDREILLSIINNYGGGPVGAETLAISIGESVDSLEDYYEPYLIQCGLLQRTPRGRIVTEKARLHLGLEGSCYADQRLLF